MIIVFRAISGAGKSTAVEYLKTGESHPEVAYTPLHNALKKLRGHIKKNELDLVVYSADDYFYDEHGRYNFDPAKLSEAHAQCLERFTTGLLLHKESAAILEDQKQIANKVLGHHPHKHDVVHIVDNTNCSIAEVAPYAALAGAYKHELHIFTLLVHPLTAWRRNLHNVPMTNIVKQDLYLRKSILEWPPWWPQQIFQMGDPYA